MSKPRLILGLMSGTSVDGIDAALVRVKSGARGEYRAEVLRHAEVAWPDELRRRLLAVMAPAETTTREICELNAAVAERFAAAAMKVMRAAGVAAGEVAAIGSHGQTICHLPVGNAKRKTQNAKQAATGSTLQIGDLSVMAQRTGIRVVGNFRAADMAVGGQGAPLVPWADAMMLTDARRSRAVQNIGGIANVTYLPRSGVRGKGEGGSGGKVIAFDSGPGNMLMDAVVRLATRGRERFDRGGRMAAQGKVCGRLLRRLQAHPYFARGLPKSTGREAFGEAYARRVVELHENRGVSPEDMVHTLARLTAWSIADAYRRFLPRMPEEVILCGGGADNPVLVGMLGEELGAGGGKGLLRRIDEFGIPNKAKEAASFALLAAATLDGVPGNLPAVTGARRAVVLGQVAVP